MAISSSFQALPGSSQMTRLLLKHHPSAFCSTLEHPASILSPRESSVGKSSQPRSRSNLYSGPIHCSGPWSSVFPLFVTSSFICPTPPLLSSLSPGLCVLAFLLLPDPSLSSDSFLSSKPHVTPSSWRVSGLRRPLPTELENFYGLQVIGVRWRW